jgi:hypothetical protein
MASSSLRFSNVFITLGCALLFCPPLAADVFAFGLTGTFDPEIVLLLTEPGLVPVRMASALTAAIAAAKDGPLSCWLLASMADTAWKAVPFAVASRSLAAVLIALGDALGSAVPSKYALDGADGA